MSILTIQQVLRWAKDQLAQQDDAMFESQLLLAHVLQQSRAYLIAHPEQIITEAQRSQFTTFIERRKQNEPIAYITGTRDFWTFNLIVTPDTLIPRPETELLVQAALDLLPEVAHVIDLGTGSGAIALALATERPRWQIVAVDQSEAALQVAQLNAQRLGITNVTFIQSNWFDNLPAQQFHAVISNPPYIAEAEWSTYASGLAFEPRSALLSGQDGLDDIRMISKQSRTHLYTNGFLLLEHGFNQAQAVRVVLGSDDYEEIHSIRDLAGLERITVSRWR